MRAVVLGLVFFAFAMPAAAHVGRPVLPDAIAALQAGQVYVDFDATPTLTRLEAERLASALPDGVRIAVMPESVTRESGTDSQGVAQLLADSVGKKGVYLVVLGGSLVTVDATPAVRQAFEARRSEGLGPAIEAAADVAGTTHAAGRGANWPAFAVSMLLGLVALCVLAYRARQKNG